MSLPYTKYTHFTGLALILKEVPPPLGEEVVVMVVLVLLMCEIQMPEKHFWVTFEIPSVL